MRRPFSQAYLTTAPFDAPEAIRIAGALGYDYVGVRILPASPGGIHTPLIGNRPLLAETLKVSQDCGVGIFDVEIIRLKPDFNISDFAGFLDVCGTLQAKAILVAGDDPDESRLTASYARFCEAAAPYQLTADLEFMPWTSVKDAKTALRIVRNAQQPNARILVDTLHAGRSTTTLADLASLPDHLLSYAQICDAPAELPTTHEGLIFTARVERMLPGSGGMDLVGMFTQLPATLPVSVEIPSESNCATLGQEEWSRRALTASKTLIAGLHPIR